MGQLSDLGASNEEMYPKIRIYAKKMSKTSLKFFTFGQQSTQNQQSTIVKANNHRLVNGQWFGPQAKSEWFRSTKLS